MEHARRQVKGLTKVGNNVQATLLHVLMYEVVESMRRQFAPEAANQSPCWIQENDAFKNCLKSDLDLVGLNGSMFFIYDGNHRLLAWKEVIETLHAEDQHSGSSL